MLAAKKEEKEFRRPKIRLPQLGGRRYGKWVVVSSWADAFVVRSRHLRTEREEEVECAIRHFCTCKWINGLSKGWFFSTSFPHFFYSFLKNIRWFSSRLITVGAVKWGFLLLLLLLVVGFWRLRRRRRTVVALCGFFSLRQNFNLRGMEGVG